LGGRKSFHGSRELLASDHADSASLSTVLSKARVVPLPDYVAEVNAARRASGDGDYVPDDLYFQRFKFCVAKRGGADGGVAPARFEPDRVVVTCECALPLNPDQRYVECSGCGDACHPACVGLPDGTTEPPDGWVCKRCAAPGDGVDNSDTTETTNIG
jgi:PHD-finger